MAPWHGDESFPGLRRYEPRISNRGVFDYVVAAEFRDSFYIGFGALTLASGFSLFASGGVAAPGAYYTGWDTEEIICLDARTLEVRFKRSSAGETSRP